MAWEMVGMGGGWHGRWLAWEVVGMGGGWHRRWLAREVWVGSRGVASGGGTGDASGCRRHECTGGVSCDCGQVDGTEDTLWLILDGC